MMVQMLIHAKKSKMKRSLSKDRCSALLRVRLMSSGLRQGVKFVVGHSHLVFSSNKKHFLGDNMEVTSCHKSLIDTFNQALKHQHFTLWQILSMKLGQVDTRILAFQ